MERQQPGLQSLAPSPQHLVLHLKTRSGLKMPLSRPRTQSQLASGTSTFLSLVWWIVSHLTKLYLWPGGRGRLLMPDSNLAVGLPSPNASASCGGVASSRL